MAGRTVLVTGGTGGIAFSAEDPSHLFAPLVAVMRPFMRSPERGADTVVYLASAPEVAGISGQYFADRRAKRTHATSYDPEATRRLWHLSAELVGLPAGGTR